MRYFKIRNRKCASEEADRLVDRLFWLLDERGIFRAGVDRFCLNVRSRVDLGKGLHQENDFEHSLLVALIIWLLDEYFGNWMDNVDFYTEIKTAFIHDAIEVILGDIPHNGEGDREEKTRIERSIMRTYLKEFSDSTRDELNESLTEFYKDRGIVFMADKMSFVVIIAWYLYHGVEGNWRLMKELYGLSKWDRENFRYLKKYHVKSGTEILDAMFKCFLELTVDDYYRPLFILLAEALYRKVGEEIPDVLYTLY